MKSLKKILKGISQNYSETLERLMLNEGADYQKIKDEIRISDTSLREYALILEDNIDKIEYGKKQNLKKSIESILHKTRDVDFFAQISLKSFEREGMCDLRRMGYVYQSAY